MTCKGTQKSENNEKKSKNKMGTIPEKSQE